MSILDKQAAEIDRHILPNAHTNGILEEIEKRSPGIAEAMNANFKYALRAKNFETAEKLKAEKDPKRDQIVKEQSRWQERVRQVMLLYYQEYGFGRIIGPRLNWSGVFRSDEWLMNHFHNPTSTSPKSLMPAFPFDDSKFYALTYMLDALAVKNSDAIHKVWEHRGFNPALAFETHCAQCHGDHRQGNGVVAEWIYPIPKNLTNATFLRNLTKEQAITSITHGVYGTPMPPWGEVASGKQHPPKQPVLSKVEIKQLVDWLFSSLAGEQVIENSSDVLKWQYTPEDVLKEIRHEGDQLKRGPAVEQLKDQSHHNLKSNPSAHAALRRLMPSGEGLYGALKPVPAAAKVPSDVEAVFEIKPPFYPGGDPTYYIKKDYYTEQNLEAGRLFFENNCAICHGKDADGTGLRAETMTDAKPRMLINLNWLDKRDDLRLLRSIKYGVPGTAMTPWGDQTSSLQRMQLVMYIRSLSAQNQRLAELKDLIYQAFGVSEEQIDLARSKEYGEVGKIEKESRELKGKLNEQSDAEATAAFEKERQFRKQLQGKQEHDQLYVSLKESVDKESQLFTDIGKDMIQQEVSDDDFRSFANLVQMRTQRFAAADGQLKLIQDQESQAKQAQGKLINRFGEQIAQLTTQIKGLEGQIPTKEQVDQLKTLTAQQKSLLKLKEKLISNFSQAERLEQEQLQYYNKITSKE